MSLTVEPPFFHETMAFSMAVGEELGNLSPEIWLRLRSAPTVSGVSGLSGDRAELSSRGGTCGTCGWWVD